MPTVILKPTESCNSGCRYCDVIHKRAPLTMSPELLELVYVRLAEYLEEKPGEVLEVVWHGGEPLLPGVDFYNRVLDLHGKYCAAHGSRVRYSLQSNLTLLTPELAMTLKELGITAVGTSYEPIPGIRGIGGNCDHQAYQRAFLRGLSVLLDHRMSWGFIYVVHRKSLADPLGLFYRLVNMKPDGAFMFNPVLIYGEDEHGLAVTPEEYSAFLGEVFTEWWRCRHRFPAVQPFAGMVANYTSSQVSLTCVHSGSCAYGHLYVGPRGETSQCGRSADWSICEYGSIHDATLAELFTDGRRRAFDERTHALEAGECGGCRFWKICHGGCPLDAYPADGKIGPKSPWCAFTRHFLEKFFEPVTGMTFGA